MVSSLHAAIRNGDVDLVVQLIAMGANVNELENQWHDDPFFLIPVLDLDQDLDQDPKMQPLSIAARLTDPVAATTIINALVPGCLEFSTQLNPKKATIPAQGT